MVNAVTEKAGLVFNVNSVKGNMKNFYANQALEKPQFSGGHIAITAALQRFCEYLVRNVYKATAVDKSGVRRVTRSTFRFSLLSHEGLSEYYMSRIRHFRKNMMYLDQLPVTADEVSAVCDRVDKDMVVTPKARNMLAFCLVEAYQDLVSTVHQFLTHSGKKQLIGTTVVFAIRNRFHDSVAYDLCTEVERAMKASDLPVKALEDDEDAGAEDDVAEDSADEDEEEEEAAKPAKGAKNKAKAQTQKADSKTKKAAKKIEESESSDEDEVLDDDSDEEEEEGEEVEAKPAKPAKKGAKAGQKADAKKSAPKGKQRRAAN